MAPPTKIRLLVPLVLVAVACALAAATEELTSLARSPFPLYPTLPYAPVLAGRGEPPLSLEGVSVPLPFTVRRRQTLAASLDGLGVSPRDAYDVANALAEHVNVRKIRAGEDGVVWFDDDSRLRHLRLIRPLPRHRNQLLLRLRRLIRPRLLLRLPPMMVRLCTTSIVPVVTARASADLRSPRSTTPSAATAAAWVSSAP